MSEYHPKQTPSPLLLVELREGGELVAVPSNSGAPDNRIQINAAMTDNPLTRPGLRLNWPQESETK